MHRFACALVLTSALAAPHAALGQTVDAPAGSSTAQAALDAAKLRESAAVDAYNQAAAATRASEAAALAAARGEVQRRLQQVAEVEAAERDLIGLLDRIEALQRQPEKLLLELVVLERWYADLQPAVANLTPRSFRGTEAELAALARAGRIEAGPRSFTSYASLGTRIGEVGRLLAARRAANERETAALRTQLGAANARRNRALQNLAGSDLAMTAPPQNWLDAVREQVRLGANVDLTSSTVDAAFKAVLADAARLRPPILSGVTATIDGQAVYSATWERGDGTTPDEREREARRRSLLEQRGKLEVAIGDLNLALRSRSEMMIDLAALMHRRSGELQRSASRYAEKRLFQARSALALDIGLTVAELLITGGTATLARKSVAATQAITARQAARESSEWAIERAIRERSGDISAPLDQSLREVARNGADAIEGEIRTMTRQLIDRGVPADTAMGQARRMFEPALAGLRATGREYALANEVLNRTSRNPNRSAGELLRTLNEEAGRAANVDIPAKAVGEGASKILFADAGPTGGVATSNTVASTAVGELIENAISVGANTWAATPTQIGNLPLSKVAALQSKLANGITMNKVGLGAGVVFSAMETAYAGYQDARVNGEARRFGELMSELAFYYAIYRNELMVDDDIKLVMRDLRTALGTVNGTLAMLDGGLKLSSRPAPRNVRPDAMLDLALVFSAPLAAAPVATIEGVAIALTRRDPAGLRWAGRAPLAAFGRSTGAKRLEVSASDRSTPFGGLDSDPATPAIRLTSRIGWKGFEPGPDRRHLIPIFGQPEQPAPPPPAGVVRAEDLVGAWQSFTYYCDGDIPEERLVISLAAPDRLIATKTQGDACVRTGEVSWRGTLQGKTIQGEFRENAAGAPASQGKWRPWTLEVISRDEISGNGMRFVRGAAAPQPIPPSEWMTGTFSTSYGTMTLQDGRGSYTDSNGTLVPLRITGHVLDGEWVQPSSSRRCADGRYRGRVRFVFTERGFTGTWAYCDDPLGGTWNGTRQK